MAGKRSLSDFNSTEGGEFSGLELAFGETAQEEEDDNLSEEQIQAAANAEDGLEDDPGDTEEEDSDAEGDDEDDVEYEDDEDGEDEEDDAQQIPPAAATQTQTSQDPPGQSHQQEPSGSTPNQPQRALHEILTANENDLVTRLAEGAFKLPKEEAELFEEEGLPEFIARNNARTYVKTLASVSQMLHAALPAVVSNLSNVHAESRSLEQQFYDAHQDLKDVPSSDLGRIAAFVKQQQPNLNRQQLMQATANAARFFYGKQAVAPKSGKPNGQKNGIKTRSRVPYVPANRNSGAKNQGRQALKKRDPLLDLNQMLMTQNWDD